MTKKAKLDSAERELLSSYDRGEWRSSAKSSQDLEPYRAYASAALEAKGLVSIALPEQDLKTIRRRAAEAGVPYQTLIADVVHRFAAGQLVEKRRA